MQATEPRTVRFEALFICRLTCGFTPITMRLPSKTVERPCRLKDAHSQTSLLQGGIFFKIYIPGDALNDLGFFSKSPLPTNTDSMSPV